MEEVREWIPISKEIPLDNQPCEVLFNDETESHGIYWKDLGVFALSGPLTSFDPQNITHWRPKNENI